jgi:hypothetical protein
MKKAQYLITLWFLISVSFSCEKEPRLITHEELYISPLYTQFEYRDTGEVDFTYQEYRLGSFLDSDEPAYRWDDWDKITSKGPAILVDVMLGFRQKHYFGLEFWADPPAEEPWTEAHLKAMFQPGKVFAFGEGPGKVDLSILNQDYDFFSDERSKSTYLTSPTGQLEITKVEDYSYRVLNSDEVQGLLVHCTFEGLLGRFDQVFSYWQEDFTTSTELEVQNGEAAFFLAYR